MAALPVKEAQCRQMFSSCGGAGQDGNGVREFSLHFAQRSHSYPPPLALRARECSSRCQ